MIHRQYFFDSVRDSLFNGALTDEQVAGLTTFLDWYDTQGNREFDDRQLAYILATTYHETAQTMQPIAEYGKGEGHEYGQADPDTGQTYYGRGYVQLTWKENYQSQDKKLGLNGKLVDQPDLAMQPAVALEICCYGMLDGDFTGKALADYIHSTVTNFYDARTIINGHDRADDVSGYATAFANAITHTRKEINA